jgi:hypothetical protein
MLSIERFPYVKPEKEVETMTIQQIAPHGNYHRIVFYPPAAKNKV